MTKYLQYYEGDWLTPRRRGWKMACCSCGLVHRVNFRINRHGQIQLQAFTDNRATAARRRKKARSNGV